LKTKAQIKNKETKRAYWIQNKPNFALINLANIKNAARILHKLVTLNGSTFPRTIKLTKTVPNTSVNEYIKPPLKIFSSFAY